MMTIDFLQTAVAALARLRRRLVVDTAGNTFILVAAAMLPMLALIGGGIDMGRSYLSETRLQQACDSGVLAARKAIGTTVVSTGIIPSSASTIGNRFFNTNFPSGAYGSANRAFTMTLEEDYSVSGVASADVPTTIMRVFGKTNVPVRVSCTAKLNFSNTDVMMVLDVTGSMAETNPGDSMSRIESLKSTVQGFFTIR
ncbi:TadE/TadG family type IV pilus assembly protein [Novosphingobium colocasiae]